VLISSAVDSIAADLLAAISDAFEDNDSVYFYAERSMALQKRSIT